MASEQLSRREITTTTEREVPVEKDKVPKIATHFEHLSVKDKEPPHGTVDAFQQNEINKDHAGKAIGDIGGTGKTRETHELGSNFDSLSDRNNKQNAATKDRGEERFGGVRDVGNFEVESKGNNNNKSLGDREQLDRRTKVVTGTPQHNKPTKTELGTGQVVAEKATKGEQNFGTGRLGYGAENERAISEKNAAEQRERERAREAKEEEEKRLTLEEISKYRNQAQENAMEAISGAQERYEEAKKPTNETLTNTTQTAQGKEATKDTVSCAAKTAAEKAAQAKNATIEKSQQGYEATKDTVSSAAKTAAEKAAQAKNTTIEKGQQGYVATKDTVSSVAKTAAEYVSPVAEKTKTVVVDLKDKATAAGWTAAHYSTQLTVDGTKAAANVVEGAARYAAPKAAELAAKSVDVVKGLAASAGESAKEFTARKKEESWREYEAKRASQPLQEGEYIPTSEGIGENVSNYTQKMVPTGERIQAQGPGNQVDQGRGSNVVSSIGETVGKLGEKVKKPIENMTSSGNQVDQGGGSNVVSGIGETVGKLGEKVKKPIENVISSGEEKNLESTEQGKGGSDVLGAVKETVSDIGNNMIKSGDNKVVERGVTQEGQGGVLDAIGETIAEIAHTTKVIVVGEGDVEEKQNKVSMKNIGSESRSKNDNAKHEAYQSPKSV
ncbi:seed biotin-containing protein SBP65 [Cicer arietinum]|uniref:Seed biotin-containing protein SBP65 n=1 Tax=Cicer arietinum TaxID=3827 RepID=A0A1S2XET4_CICAR|nr:seed biotin-containing protein SBP65 [Cicer arietinum]